MATATVLEENDSSCSFSYLFILFKEFSWIFLQGSSIICHHPALSFLLWRRAPPEFYLCPE